LLITPVQRMPRYELLIRELIKSTETSHCDYSKLVEAKKTIEKNNKTINMKKREQETRRKLYEIEQSIVSNAPMMILAPHRFYIRDGPLSFTHKDQLDNSGHVFLLNDIILLTKSKMEKDKNGEEITKYVYVTTISVKDMKLKDSGKKLQFYVLQGPEIWEFYCVDEDTKREWTTAMNDTLETLEVNEMLSKAGTDEPVSKIFSVYKASYGILKDPTQVADVTQIVQEIVKQQGGKQLLLNSGSKTNMFGNPSKSKNKQLMLVYSIKGVMKTEVFNDVDAIKLSSEQSF